MADKKLIAGIPGTGKTTVGNELQQNHGYRHIDLETDALQSLAQNPGAFIDALVTSPDNVVVTWGFVPDEIQTSIVLLFKSKGFKVLWFGGNREAARVAFNKRGTVSEESFNHQVKEIDDFEVVRKIDPIIYDSFTKNGKFKKREVIAKQIKNK